MNYQEFHELCLRRRSIRYFGGEPVSKEQVLQLLELARMAPNVQNTQPWHFHVVFNPEMRKRLMETSCYGNFVEGAGVFLVVAVDRSLEPKSPETLWNPKELEYSCMAAMENVLLGATALDLGSCWVSMHHGPAHAALRLPTHHAVIGGIMLGSFKKGEEEPSGEHQRKPLETMYTFHE
jgi:nitroreductase